MDHEIERFELQVKGEDGWRAVQTGTYTGWMQDSVERGDEDRSKEHRCYDVVTHQVMSRWDPETQEWDECPTLEPEQGEVPEVTVHQTICDVHDEGPSRRIAVEVSCKHDGVFLNVQGHGEKTALEGRPCQSCWNSAAARCG